MAGSSGTACPCFPCAFFGRRFLSRMRKCVTSHGRPQAASMPHRTEMGIPAHFPSGVHILPRNRRRKRSTENRDRHSRCCRPLKKLTHGLGKKECWYFLLFPKRHGETGPSHNIPSYFTQHGRDFFAGRRQRERLSRFSVLRFRREFLSRMRTLKGNRARMHGLARCGMDAA